MKKINLITAIFSAFALMSFVTPDSGKYSLITMGTYSVCAGNNSNSGSVKLGLTINADFTFHYFDNSNPEKSVDVRGNWQLKNNTIFLDNYSSDFPLERKWTVNGNKKCITSRKGLRFTRLCNVAECK